MKAYNNNWIDGRDRDQRWVCVSVCADALVWSWREVCFAVRALWTSTTARFLSPEHCSCLWRNWAETQPSSWTVAPSCICGWEEAAAWSSSHKCWEWTATPAFLSIRSSFQSWTRPNLHDCEHSSTGWESAGRSTPSCTSSETSLRSRPSSCRTWSRISVNLLCPITSSFCIYNSRSPSDPSHNALLEPDAANLQSIKSVCVPAAWGVVRVERTSFIYGLLLMNFRGPL